MNQQMITDLAQKASDDAVSAMLRTLNLLDDNEDRDTALTIVSGSLLYAAASATAGHGVTAEMALTYALTTILACARLYGIRDLSTNHMDKAMKAVSAASRDFFKAID